MNLTLNTPTGVPFSNTPLHFFLFCLVKPKGYPEDITDFFLKKEWHRLLHSMKFSAMGFTLMKPTCKHHFHVCSEKLEDPSPPPSKYF